MKKVKKIDKKVITIPLDLKKLPDKYFFGNREDLTDNKYIDDNSLFVYYCISKGFFSEKLNSKNPKVDSTVSFLFLHPFEWISVDFVSFLLSVTQKYNLKIENIKTTLGAIQDNYETSYQPRKYGGAYNWILELEKKDSNREEVLLFNKITGEKASVLDLERVLIYADRIAPVYKDEKNELWLSKDIFISKIYTRKTYKE